MKSPINYVITGVSAAKVKLIIVKNSKPPSVVQVIPQTTPARYESCNTEIPYLNIQLACFYSGAAR